jgi:hypothetical protein
VGLDRLEADVEPLGDLGVGCAGCRQLGDPQLAGGQGGPSGGEQTRATPATGPQLLVSVLAQALSSAGVRELQAGYERLAPADPPL